MLALVILFSSIFLVFLIYRTTRTRPCLPPGPTGIPLIGNLHQLPNSDQHRYLWRLSKQYGPLIFLRFGLKPTIVVSSAKIARQVMKTHDLVFASRPSLLGQQKLSYNGLDVAFAPYGDYWREVRKLCGLHLFSTRRIHSFRPIREDEVLRTIRRLCQPAASHKVINLSNTMMSFTGTLICRIAFGNRYELEDNKVSERSGFHGLLHESQALLTEFYLTVYIPCLGWIDRIRGLHSRLDKTFKQLDMFYQQVIDDHMNPKNPQTDQKDVIDIFLQIMNAHSTSVDLTMDHIKALLMNIFIAGTDTSAATQVWAMTSLMKNPRMMKKVQDEIRKLYGNKDFISEEDIERLPYMKAVVKETLRLFPPLPLLVPRESIEKCDIEGYEIQPKTLVFVNAWAIGRDPKTWEEPEQFYPKSRNRRKCSDSNLGYDVTDKESKSDKEVQDEIRSLYSEKDFIGEGDIERLPYLKAVVKGTMRLFPPTPLLLPRESTETCNIEGYEIQAKTLVFVNAWAIARDPEIWENAEQFYPERF